MKKSTIISNQKKQIEALWATIDYLSERIKSLQETRHREFCADNGDELLVYNMAFRLSLSKNSPVVISKAFDWGICLELLDNRVVVLCFDTDVMFPAALDYCVKAFFAAYPYLVPNLPVIPSK